MTQYFLNIRSYQANFEIRLNDVLIECDYGNQNMSYTVPVNHWLRGEKNLLSFRLIPHEGDSALRLNARLELAIERGTPPPGGEGEMELREHFAICSRDISGEFGSEVPGFTHMAAFFIEGSRRLPWEDGAEIPLSERSLHRARAVYQRLHRFIADKDAAGFVDFTRRKIASCAEALHWDLEEDIRFSKAHFTEVFSKPGYELWPLPEQQLIPSLDGFGKLISLRNQKKQPPLLLYNEAEGSCIFIDVKLYQPGHSDEFVVIR